MRADTGRRLATLTDAEAYERVFGLKIDVQNVSEAVEHLTAAAIKTEDDSVVLPTDLAVAATLILKGIVRRPRARPRRTPAERRLQWWTKRSTKKLIRLARRFQAKKEAHAVATGVLASADSAADDAAVAVAKRYCKQLVIEADKRRRDDSERELTAQELIEERIKERLLDRMRRPGEW